MHKFGGLFVNEMLKNFKKISVFILMIVMTVGMIGCSSMYKVFDSDDDYDDYSSVSPEEADREQAEEIETYIKDLESQLEDEPDPDRRAALSDELYNNRISLLYYQLYTVYAKDNNISDLSYKYDLLSEMYDIKIQMINYDTYGGADSSQYEELEARYDELDGYVKGDFASYTENENRKILENNMMSEAVKDARIAYNNAVLAAVPDGTFESYQQEINIKNLFSKISEIKASLENGIDVSEGGNLTDERRAALEKDLEVYEKRISAGNIDSDSDYETEGNSYTTALSVGNMISLVIVILLAGSLMSHEISTGTIKSLIIAPVKRWKIYTAKYLSLITFIVFLSLFTFGVTTLTNGLLFGFGSFTDKTVYAFGRAVNIGYFTYYFLSNIFNMITLTVVATFAYMMSVVTKNTAASVSVTMGIYLGGNFVHIMLMGGLRSYPYAVKFLPFSNIDLFGRVFYMPYDISEGINLGSIFEIITDSLSVDIPVLFSAMYIVVILVCMIYTGLDSFCRRDIK